ncbi:MAG TPA: response regulator [Allosphingosinicella sp.]|jgi:CheY-like chemotaxis protein
MMASIEILRATSRKPPLPVRTTGPGEDAPTDLGVLKVLIVEDESVIAWALQSLLEDLGHEVVAVASSGEAAVAAAAKHHPQLVMMDINLGRGPDGIEAAQRILSNGSAHVIFVSAYADEGTRARIAERVPGAPLVAKPVSARSIQSALATAFARQH